MVKEYLKEGDEIVCIDSKLKIVEGRLELVSIMGDMYYDGLLVNWGEGGYYIER